MFYFSYICFALILSTGSLNQNKTDSNTNSDRLNLSSHMVLYTELKAKITLGRDRTSGEKGNLTMELLGNRSGREKDSPVSVTTRNH